jgi:hypothetical protein
MENIFWKMETSSENATGVDGTNSHISRVKSEGLETQKPQGQGSVNPEECLGGKKERDVEQTSDSDDNEDVNLNQAASTLEDMLTHAEDYTNSSVAVPDTKEDVTESIQGTSFVSDVMLPKPLPGEHKKDKKRESKSRKELEEEEREKMQYVLNT